METDHILLRQSLGKHVALTDDEFSRFLTFAQVRTYRKGQFLIHAGSTIRKTHFIKKGAAIAYFIDLKGQEHVIQFGIEGWWISDIQSYIKGSPAMLHVQAIETCDVYEFTAENMQQAYELLPQIETYFLIITQNAFATFQERVLQNISMSAEEKYLAFSRSYPKLELRLPQRLIASYLGISAEFLSKVRKRLNTGMQQKTASEKTEKPDRNL